MYCDETNLKLQQMKVHSMTDFLKQSCEKKTIHKITIHKKNNTQRKHLDF